MLARITVITASTWRELREKWPTHATTGTHETDQMFAFTDAAAALYAEPGSAAVSAASLSASLARSLEGTQRVTYGITDMKLTSMKQQSVRRPSFAEQSVELQPVGRGIHELDGAGAVALESHA